MMKKGGFFILSFMFRPIVNLANKRKGKGRIKRKSRLINRRRRGGSREKTIVGIIF